MLAAAEGTSTGSSTICVESREQDGRLACARTEALPSAFIHRARQGLHCAGVRVKKSKALKSKRGRGEGLTSSRSLMHFSSAYLTVSTGTRTSTNLSTLTILGFSTMYSLTTGTRRYTTCTMPCQPQGIVIDTSGRNASGQDTQAEQVY
eukprot:2270893-Rhodomonas_salina.1